MKKTIYKYPIKAQNAQKVTMPIGAEILSVQVQNNEPFLYALVNPDNQSEERFVRTYPTGGNVPVEMGLELKYIGTFILNDPSHTTGTFVGHLFEQL